MRVLLRALPIVLLAGCTITPSDAIGPPPANYRKIAAVHVKNTFNDPYSIRDASISQPKMGKMLIDNTMAFEAGWTICVRSRAKNKMGAYTGLRQAVFLIRGNDVLMSRDDTPIVGQYGTHTHVDIQENCTGVGYEPFSEIEERR